jgi:hypothetical protein
MNVVFDVKGATPLLYHNERLADPLDPIVREIKRLSGKKDKTDDDHRRIAELEWLGGVYTSVVLGPEGFSKMSGNLPILVLPTKWVRKALKVAGTVTKKGTALIRALSMTTAFVPLQYEGETLRDAFANPRYWSRMSVGVNKNRVMRVRPMFEPWAAQVPAVFFGDAGLNWDELVSIAKLSGQICGLGDNREYGYGRCEIVVREVK